MDIYKVNFTKIELEIFSLLCIKAGEELSQREISQILKVSPTAIMNSIPQLNKSELIVIKKTKTINFISFNRNNKRAIELKRIENLKNIYISELFNYLEIALAGSTIILFGSYSKGEDTTASDIDILIIGAKEKEIKLTAFDKLLERTIFINFYPDWNIKKNLRNNILNGIVLRGSVEI